MKIYRGERGPLGCRVTVDGAALDPRVDLRCHSPAGFEWGYDGTGPRQLALAILADCLGDDLAALNAYQIFTEGVIATLQRDRWTLSDEAVRASLEHVVEVPMDLATLLDRVRGRR